MARHPADLFSLVGGLVALAFGLMLLTGGIGDVPMEWVGPAVAIAIGVMILVAARPSRSAEDGPSLPTDDA
jgi:divalent metal cation (Fe/Co/Zn/Cd) transporter